MKRLSKTTSSRYFSTIKYKEELQRYYQRNPLIKGYCREQKSLFFSKRNPIVHHDNWRTPIGISERIYLSSMGLGTRNGQPTQEHDYQMFRAIVDTVLAGGVNIMDSCASYRKSKSQKCINAALNYLTKERGYSREEFFVSTKCGYVPHDIDNNLDQQFFIKVLSKRQKVDRSEFVKGIHCINPYFLGLTIEKSRVGLGLSTIDLVYINNFSQSQLSTIGDQLAFNRLREAFIKLEEMRAHNHIRYYGLCSNVGLISPPTAKGVHFPLQRALNLAKEIAGHNHGLRFIMVPFSLGSPEVLLKRQYYNDGKKKEALRIFDIAEKEKINIVTCSPLSQGKLNTNFHFQNKKLELLTDESAKHLQFIRSYPSRAFLSTIVGQTKDQHIKQNMKILQYPKLKAKEWKEILPIPE